MQPDELAVRITGSAFLEDPYPLYRELLASAQPAWLPLPQASGSPGMWLFSRHADVQEVLLESTGAISKEADSASLLDGSMLNRDPPDHGRLRGALVRCFAAPRIRKLESDIARTADELIDAVLPVGRMDFIRDFAEPLPVAVISRLLGVAPGDVEWLNGQARLVLSALDSTSIDGTAAARRSAAEAELEAYWRRVLTSGPPPTPLRATLAEARAEGALTIEEEIAACFLLVVAGFETTVGLLGNGLLTLFRWPAQLRRLQADPELLPAAIEEMLRFESPAQRSTFRVAARGCEIGGHAISEGERICALLGAANRDPLRFPEPDEFDIGRSPNRHVAFGTGIHACLGAALARTEAKVAFRRLLALLPGIRLATDGWQWSPNTFMRRLQRLEVAF